MYIGKSKGAATPDGPFLCWGRRYTPAYHNGSWVCRLTWGWGKSSGYLCPLINFCFAILSTGSL